MQQQIITPDAPRIWRPRTRRFSPTGIGIGCGIHLAHGGGFSGDFRSLMSTAEIATILQYVQPDLAVTLGGTPLAAGTAPPAMTLTGSAATATGLRFDCPTGGVGYGTATFRYSTDDGATFSAPTLIAATTLIASGPAAGITANWPNSTYTSDNTWKATCSALPDQAASNVPFSQTTPALRPNILSVGLNGRPVLQFTAGTHSMSAIMSLPVPTTTNTFIWTVFRDDVWHASGAQDILWSDNAGAAALLAMITATPTLYSYDGSNLTNDGATVGSWLRGEQLFAGDATSYLKLGSTAASTGNNGNNAGVSPLWLGWTGTARVAAFSIASRIVFNAKPSAATLAAMSAGAQARWGSGVLV